MSDLKFDLSRIHRYWPLIIALTILCITILALLSKSMSLNHGLLIYVLDDPYIHMAMAKNFALHGVWGVTQYGFTSSSSSPLWILLLSASYRLVGVNETLPLILNMIFATIILFMVYYILKTCELPPAYNLIFLLAIIFFTPLPALIFTGMEHTLQIILVIIFIYISAKVLSKNNLTILQYSILLILATLLVMTRYESLFLVLVVSILFMIKKRFLYSIIFLGAGLTPIIFYGVIANMNGWPFLPNSLILKSFFVETNTPLFSLEALYGLLDNFKNVTGLSIFITVIGALALLIFRFNKKEKVWEVPDLMIIIFIGTTILHMLFAKIGWFYRYEAYLVALGILVIAIGVRDYLPEIKPKLELGKTPKYMAMILLIFLIIIPLADRGYNSLVEVPTATHNVYDQQYQMGVFVKNYYQGNAIALNDIGAVNYLADVKSVDLLGLGDLNVSQSRTEGTYNIEKINNITKQKNVKVVIVYEDLFNKYITGGLPPQWIKVGEWKIPNRVSTFMDTVSIYVIDPSDKENLTRTLRDFSAQLPSDVQQSGKYMDNEKG